MVVCTAVAGLLGAAFVGSASPTLREVARYLFPLGV